jgi:hypothetical protein
MAESDARGDNKFAMRIVCLTVVLSVAPLSAAAQEPCPEGTLFEPYSRVCASVNDRRDWWLTPSQATLKLAGPMLELPNLDEFRPVAGPGSQGPRQQKPLDESPPEPGAINAGTTYRSGVLTVNTSGRLHTKMFVHPEGLNPSDFLGWTFTPATNHVDSAVEVVGIYRSALGDSGVLSIFGRPCTPQYPCPDGDTSNGWQPSKDFSELPCNISQIVDGGGHAQKIVHYANHSDRLDDADPALWRNAVYLWNYCAGEWDLIWEHTYRENKRDCSVVGCYWWATGFELSGDPFPRPQINELGYEDTLLFHDGVWSELRPDETGFRNPEDRPDLSPWQLFHLDANRGFGAGNFLNENDPPVIVGQAVLSAPEDTDFEIRAEDLTIQDPDIDPAYHVHVELSVFNGDNYTRVGTIISPAADFFGDLSVPITVSDGAADSLTYDLSVQITPVNDAPVLRLPMGDRSFDQDAQVVLDAASAFADPDMDPLTFVARGLPASLTITSRGIIEGTVTNQDALDSPFLVTVTAADPLGLQSIDDFQLTVVNVNDPPVVDLPIADQTYDQGAAVSLDVSGSFLDIDEDALTFSALDLPPSLTMSSEGQISGVLTNDDALASPFVVQITADDGQSGSVSTTFELVVENVNDAPVFTTAAVIGVTEASAYLYEIRTHDPDGDPVEVRAVTLPGWLTLIDQGDGAATLQGTPTGTEVGDHPVTLEVSDPQALATSQSFTVAVAAASDGPVINLLGDDPLTINQNQAFVDPGATASDPQDGNLTSQVVADSSVNIRVAGSYEVIYRVSDTAGNSATATRVVTVRAAAIATSRGGGATDLASLVLLLAASIFRPRPGRPLVKPAR